MTITIDDCDNWVNWLSNVRTDDEAVKLDVLRQFIREAARSNVSYGNVSSEWANKKLVKLGITDLVDTDNAYKVQVDVTGKVMVAAYGRNRVEAVENALKQYNDGRGFWQMSDMQMTSDPQVTDGPEDVDTVVPDDAPQTVDALLAALRETILLAVVAGPHICEDGANRVLNDFGLDQVPERKRFTVTRPATVEMTTKIDAYDEASAQRVADWRWRNNLSGFQVKDAQPTGDPTVSEA